MDLNRPVLTEAEALATLNIQRVYLVRAAVRAFAEDEDEESTEEDVHVYNGEAEEGLGDDCSSVNEQSEQAEGYSAAASSEDEEEEQEATSDNEPLSASENVAESEEEYSDNERTLVAPPPPPTPYPLRGFKRHADRYIADHNRNVKRTRTDEERSQTSTPLSGDPAIREDTPRPVEVPRQRIRNTG